MHTSPSVTVIPQQQLFVIPQEGELSYLDFELCFERTQQLASVLKRQDLAPKVEKFGTLEQYEDYDTLVQLSVRSKMGTFFELGTVAEVQNVLEHCRRTDKVVRLHFGDAATGLVWLCENNIIGRISRSTNALKEPLLLEHGQISGDPIKTASIIRIQSARSGRDLYRHANFHLPQLRYQFSPKRKWPHELLHQGKIMAAFRTEAEAGKWLKFIAGSRRTP